MKEKHLENNIPPQEIVPPAEKIPPYEATPPPGQADLSESPEDAPEQRPEKMEIMEEARAERLDILSGAFERVKSAMKEKSALAKEKMDAKVPKPVQEIISMSMDISSLKMYAEAGKGKTLTGKELSPKERIISALIAGTNDIAKVLFAVAAGSGNLEYAKLGSLTYGVSWTLMLSKNGPKMLKNLKELAGHYNFSDAIPILARTEAAFSRYGYENIEGRIVPFAY